MRKKFMQVYMIVECDETIVPGLVHEMVYKAVTDAIANKCPDELDLHEINTGPASNMTMR